MSTHESHDQPTSTQCIGTYSLLIVIVILIAVFVLLDSFQNGDHHIFRMITQNVDNSIDPILVDSHNPFIITLLSKEMSKKAHIYIKKYSTRNEYYISYCHQMLADTGIGNRLAPYWLYRSLCFWWNIDFKMNKHCTCNKQDYYFCNKKLKNKNKYYYEEWINYLPHKSKLNIDTLFKIWGEHPENVTNYTNPTNPININLVRLFAAIFDEMNIDNVDSDSVHFIRTYIDTKLNISAFKQKLFKKSTNADAQYIYREFGHLLMYKYSLYDQLWLTHYIELMVAVMNEIYIEIVRFEMDVAFYLYFRQKHETIQNQWKFVDNLMINMHNNNNIETIVVHWRCGDLIRRHKVDKYGLYGLDFYKKAIETLGLNINNNKYFIYWIAQLDKTKARERDAEYIDTCCEIMNVLKPYYERLFFNKSNFILVTNGTITTDSYLLNYANYTIGIASSFYHQLILGNRNNIFYNNFKKLFKSDDVFKLILPNNFKSATNYVPDHIHLRGESVKSITEFVIHH